MTSKILLGLGLLLACSALLIYHAAAFSTPSISSLSPTCMDLGGTPPGITLTGSGFKGNSYVTVNGVPRNTYAPSSTVRQVQLLDADVSALGTVSIAVVNPRPSPISSNVAQFAVMDTPVLITSPPNLPDAIEGQPYSYTLQAAHKSLCTGNLLP